MPSIKVCLSSFKWRKNALSQDSIKISRSKVKKHGMIAISGLTNSKSEEFFFLLYDNKFFKNLWKLKMHWPRPYVVTHITDAGAVKFHKLDGTPVVGMVNGSLLKPHYDHHDMPE